MFQTTAIKSRFKDLAKLIKDSWKSGDFTELGAMVGNKLNEALERIPWGKIQNTCNKIAKSIATFLNGFIEAADWKLVGNTFSKGLNTAFGFVDTFAKNFHWNSLGKAIGDGINGALEGLDWNLIKGTVHDTVFGLVSTLNTAIATTNWSVVGKTVGECFNTRLEALYTTVHNFNWRGLGTALADLVTNTVKTIDTGKIGQTLSDGIKGFFDFAISAIEHMDWWSMGDTIYNKAKDLMVNIDWSGIADRVFETIGAAFGGFAAFIGGIFKNAVADARKYIIKHFTEAGKFTWEGFKNGVVQSFKDIGTWIKAHIFKPFINGFKKAFGIHSPSTVMRTQGGYVISGLFNGMKAGLPAVLSWIAKLPGQTKERLGNAKTWLRGKGNAAITGLKNGWEAVRESTFLSRVKKIGSQSFNAIGDIKSKVTPKGRDIISGMRTGLNNNWSSLSGILSNIPGKVANAIPSLYTVGQNVIQTFANGFSSIHIPMPHIGWDWEGGSIKIGNFKFSLPRFNLSWYANGGFPGMGEMFVARESGPELVGRMGNHSAVANNNQIIAGIRAGVFEAVVNAFESMQGRNDRGRELHIYLEGDAKKLFKVIRQEGNNYQNTNLYVKFATLTIVSNYINTPMTFKLVSRGWETSNVQIMFKSINNPDPGLDWFRADGTVPLWIKKSGTSKWDLYMQKCEPWGSCIIYNFVMSDRHADVTWTTDQVAAIPNGAVKVALLSADANAISRISAAETEISNNKKQIALKASQTEVTNLKGALGDLSVYTNKKTTMVQDITGWQYTWDTVISTDAAEIASHKDYITFDKGNIILGDSASASKLKLTKDSIQFKGTSDTAIKPDSDATAWITGKVFHINSGEIESSLKFGKVLMKPTKNGIQIGNKAEFGERVRIGYPLSSNMQYTYSDCPLVVGSNTGAVDYYPWFAVDDGYAFIRNGIITPGDFIIKFGEYTLDRPDGSKFSGTLRPYYRADDVINMEFYVNGYVTSNKQEVIFLIPFSRPIMSTKVSISSINGLTIRQNGKYIYNSTASKPIKPASYTAAVIGGRNGLNVRAKMGIDSNGFTDTDIKNIVNNDTCAIMASIKITF